MARKLRLEYPGACYHVINRGNYRADVFATEGAKAAFETCLFEACQRSNWVLHAFVVMRNHFHLVVETPEPNLVSGMHWLQATFATRFNRFRREMGHLFQGRYKALVIEPGDALGQVCHYVHLNPVRAGIVPVERLGDYRHSSYWFLQKPKARPRFFEVDGFLHSAGHLDDSAAGRRCYADYLAWQAAEGPAGRNSAYVQMSAGWSLGTKEFRKALINDHALLAQTRAWEAGGAAEVRDVRWSETLSSCLKKLGKGEEDAQNDPKSAEWKALVALRMKEISQASNRWLSERLVMGRPEAVSVYVGRVRASAAENAIYRRLTTIV